ncbi:MAG: LPS translocon maturation chaperone LptM [Gammaproteobacteria bacterium]
MSQTHAFLRRRTALRYRAALLVTASALLLAACGQTGALYLPEDNGQVIIREAGTATPPANPPPEG